MKNLSKSTWQNSEYWSPMTPSVMPGIIMGEQNRMSMYADTKGNNNQAIRVVLANRVARKMVQIEINELISAGPLPAVPLELKERGLKTRLATIHPASAVQSSRILNSILLPLLKGNTGYSNTDPRWNGTLPRVQEL